MHILRRFNGIFSGFHFIPILCRCRVPEGMWDRFGITENCQEEEEETSCFLTECPAKHIRPACPDGWTDPGYQHDYCLYVDLRQQNFHEATNNCKEMGGQLAELR